MICIMPRFTRFLETIKGIGDLMGEKEDLNERGFDNS